MKKLALIFIIFIVMILVAFVEVPNRQGKTSFHYRYRNGETFTVSKERTGDTLNISYSYSDPKKLGNLNYEYEMLFPSGKLLSALIFKDDGINQFIFRGDIIFMGKKDGEKTSHPISQACHLDLYEAMAKFVVSGNKTGTVHYIFKSTETLSTQEFNMKRSEERKIETPVGVFDAVQVTLSLPSIMSIFYSNDFWFTTGENPLLLKGNERAGGDFIIEKIEAR